MDSLIIGAGPIGASLAWRLGQRGYSVTLVDAASLCGEASHAGAGMLSPEGERFPDDVWAHRAGSTEQTIGFDRTIEPSFSIAHLLSPD